MWRKKIKKKKKKRKEERKRERTRMLSGWFAVRGPKVSENLDEFQEPGSPSGHGGGEDPFCPPSRGDLIKIGATARRGTSFRGPMPFITWRGRGSFHGRIPNENEGRKGKARCETATSRDDSTSFYQPPEIHFALSFSLCKGTLAALSCFPLLSSGHPRRCSGHVYTSVFIPLVGRANRADSRVERRKKKRRGKERKKEEA